MHLRIVTGQHRRDGGADDRFGRVEQASVRRVRSSQDEARSRSWARAVDGEDREGAGHARTDGPQDPVGVADGVHAQRST